MTTLIIFTGQLYELNKLQSLKKISFSHYVVFEEILFSGADPARKLNFNPLKLAYQRACMKWYYDWIRENISKSVEYVDYANIKDWVGDKHETFVAFDTTDRILNERLKAANISIIESHSFIIKHEALQSIPKFTSFYIHYRKKFDILMSKSKPMGGKYTYDNQNRERIPANKILKDRIEPISPQLNSYYEEAQKYVHTLTGINIDLDILKLYPISHDGAKQLCTNFIESKLKNFGPYQDFVSKDYQQLYHSELSIPLNMGLLNPINIMNLVISKLTKQNLHSVEAFVRQLFWREYVRMHYVFNYTKIVKNKLNNTTKISEKFYTASTQIEPVDACIKHAFKYGYLNHISRLMIMCNFMNLCRIHPDNIYRWFMEFSLDSYDWVMIFNVYAMGTYADGGNYTTKPYICSSNYILKMTNFPRGDWCPIFDALYYNFIYKNYSVFKNRGKIFCSQWDRLSSIEKTKRKTIANLFISKI